MRIYFIFLLVIIGNVVLADKFKVESFKINSGDISIQEKPRKNQNDEFCALIKVRTDIKGLKFDANNGINGNVDYNQGDYWVYVSPNERQLKIMVDDGSITTLDYKFPERIESNIVYLLELSSDRKLSSADANLFNLTFDFNESDVYIAKDNTAPNKCIGNKGVFKLPKGDFTFKFQKEGFNDFSQKVSVRSDSTITIKLEKGQPSQKLKLPGIATVTSEPTGAEVYLNDQKIGVTPFNEPLIAGDYNITVRKNLYHSYSATFKVQEGETKVLPTIKLLAMFGSLEIKSNVNETEIFIDRKSNGNAPISINQIESGKHSIKAENKWYHPQEKEIKVQDGKTETVNFELLPAFGELYITSEPFGAEVLIDGRKVGVTPYSDKKIISNKYRIVIKKDLFAESETNVLVVDGQKTEKNFILTKNFGTLNIIADNCDIYINDEKVGKDSYSANKISGNYKIKAIREKHKTVEKEEYLGTDQTKNLTLTPEPILGSISILSEPVESNGADIFLNNEKTGKVTPAVMPLLIGTYKITLKHSKYLEASQSISLAENENKIIKIPMQTYTGSQQSKYNFWKYNQWGSVGLVVADIIIAGVLNNLANNAYKNYQNAISTDEALNFKQKTQNFDKLTYITLSVNVVPIAWYFYSWKKKKANKNNLFKNNSYLKNENSDNSKKENSIKKYLVNIGTVLFSKPNESSEKITPVNRNSYVELIEKNTENKNFWYVSYDGHKGYIFKAVLE